MSFPVGFKILVDEDFRALAYGVYKGSIQK